MHWIENLDRTFCCQLHFYVHIGRRVFFYLFSNLTVGIEGKHHLLIFSFVDGYLVLKTRFVFYYITPSKFITLLHYFMKSSSCICTLLVWGTPPLGEVSPDGLGTFILKGYLGNAHIDGLFFIKGLPLMRKISLSFSKNSKIVWHFPKFLPEQCSCYSF